MVTTTDQATKATYSDEAIDANDDGDLETVSAKLSKLIAGDRDLRDWLLYTQHSDVEARNTKLARYRALVEVEAAEQKIWEEQERLAAARRKLPEEDDLDRGFLALSAGAGQSQTPQSLVPPATPDTTASVADSVSESNRAVTTLTASTAQKRRLNTGEAQSQPAKMAKLDSEATNSPRPTRVVIEAQPVPLATDHAKETDIESGKEMDTEVSEDLQTKVAKVSKLSDAAGIAPLAPLAPRSDRERGRDYDRGPSGYRPRSPFDKYGEDNYDECHRTYYRQDTGQYDSYPREWQGRGLEQNSFALWPPWSSAGAGHGDALAEARRSWRRG